jgi:hypothetical protein
MCSDPKQIDETCTSTRVEVDVPLPQNNEKDFRVPLLRKHTIRRKECQAGINLELREADFNG